MRQKGKLIQWKDEKGFGFIQGLSGGPQVFVHISAFNNQQRRPQVNDLITYSLTIDQTGKQQADAVLFSGEKPIQPKAKKNNRKAFLFVLVFFVVLTLLTLSAKLPITILWLYSVVSVISFFAYAFDKSSAEKNRWRTPEKTLHILAFIGGWPGALLAQRLFRHKSNKKPFLITFWLITLINCLLLAWFYVVYHNHNLPNFLT